MQSDCPYCHHPLTKVPKRSGKCCICGGRIFVNRKWSLFDRALLTDEERFISDVFDRLAASHGFNVSKDIYETVRAELTKRFGRPADWSDVTWEVHQQLIERFARVGDFQKLSFVYASQAKILHREGKDPRPAIHQQQLAWLRYLKKYRAKRVQIEAGFDSEGCSSCRNLNGGVFTIVDALADPPLPPIECSCIERTGSCHCSFVASFE